jgi:hypothetical protein
MVSWSSYKLMIEAGTTASKLIVDGSTVGLTVTLLSIASRKSFIDVSIVLPLAIKQRPAVSG